MRPSATDLILSFVRALWGNVYPQLRSASIELVGDKNLICMQFEYDGEPMDEAQEACESAVTEVIADFWQGHEFDVQHVSAPLGKELKPLKHLVFMRGEI